MTGRVPGSRLLAVGLAQCVAVTVAAQAALAISIELKDVAPDRIERQRAAVEGRLPLANTPDLGHLQQRLSDAGLKAGSPMLMRIFKDTSELEIWIQKDDRFVRFATYPICHWSGTLGPKQREGDKQTPEGFYTITSRQLHHLGRWPLAINLGFPNAFDRAHNRDGSYILMHGGCSSVGCFAMTNPVIGEVYGLAQAAIRNGQRYVPVHVFPFRMTGEALAAHAASPWRDFWTSLQIGYASFERTGRPPRVSVCEGQYRIEDATAAAAPEPAESADRRQRKAHAEITLGAIRESCPAAAVVTAESKGAGPDGKADGAPADAAAVKRP